jgi:hypothetical protein
VGLTFVASLLSLFVGLFVCYRHSLVLVERVTTLRGRKFCWKCYTSYLRNKLHLLCFIVNNLQNCFVPIISGSDGCEYEEIFKL